MNQVAWRAVLPVSIGTALSLSSDSSLYTVLATHTEAAGITLGMVGLLLSANRWVRLPLNPLAGLFIENARRRALFVPALFLGALSTAVYAMDLGYGAFLGARLLWGIAWVGIWVAGNTIVLDASPAESRGRWVGLFQTSFFLGMASGAILGGLLTDTLGYTAAMSVNAGLGLLGALVALIFLPETRDWADAPNQIAAQADDDPTVTTIQVETLPIKSRRSVAQLASAAALLATNRFTVAGMLAVTLGLYLQEIVGNKITLGNREIGLATLTGLGLGITTLVSMLSASYAGKLSDRIGRWRTVAVFLVAGVFGFLALAQAQPVVVMFGLIGIAAASGSSTSLATAIVGDHSMAARRGRGLGSVYTVGDLASAIGPPLVIWLLPLTPLTSIFSLAAAVLGIMWIIAIFWGQKRD